MYIGPLILALPPLAMRSKSSVIMSNDDGWAELNIRQFYSALTDAGNSVVISAPAENESGTGSADASPTELTSPCEFNSCPAGSPAVGANASMSRINYVNSYPVTSMRYGIQTLAPKFFGGPPDIAVAGFNVGANLGPTVQFSGTVGAAVEAVKKGIPGIAFSGSTGSQTAWDTTSIPSYAPVYAALAANLTQTLVSAGDKPYLPAGVWLNVNFPASTVSTCSSPADFTFVLSRINPAVPVLTPPDVETCGNDGRLPSETSVVGTAGGCYASVSVGEAVLKTDANATSQAFVLEKLSGILSCLPSSSSSS